MKKVSASSDSKRLNNKLKTLTTSSYTLSYTFKRHQNYLKLIEHIIRVMTRAQRNSTVAYGACNEGRTGGGVKKLQTTSHEVKLLSSKIISRYITQDRVHIYQGFITGHRSEEFY